MKEIRPNMYDDTGTCPKCGSKLRHVTYYTAIRGDRSTYSDTNKLTNQVTVTTRTEYHNVSGCRAGWCETCAKKDFDAAEEKKAAEKPSRKLLNICIVVLVIGYLIVGIQMFSSHSFEPNPVNVIVSVLTLAAIPTGIVALVVYLGKKKEYDKYKSGFRAEFTVPTDKELSALAAGCMNAQKKGDWVYLNTEEYSMLNRVY